MHNFVSIMDTLERHAQEKADELAFAALVKDTTPSVTFTYGQLRRAVMNVAAHLHGLADRGERAILLYGHPIDFLVGFLGCLYAGIIGAPAPLPNTFTSKRVMARMQGIVQDARPKLVLTTSATLAELELAYRDVPGFLDMKWVATDQIPAGTDVFDPVVVERNDVAYLQYTSGSTSTPKGVMVTHGNIMHQVDYMKRIWTKDGFMSGMACWMPYYHDMGLFSGILLPLYMSSPAYLMSPVMFIRHPERWLDVVSTYRLSHTAAPVFAFDLCSRKLTPEQRAQYDLSCMEMACLGAEPIHPGIVSNFLETFAPHGFSRDALIPGYGLAEATLAVTVTPLTGGPVVTAFDRSDLARRVVTPAEGGDVTWLVGSGRPLADVPVVIVDEKTGRRCEPNQIGEIWVGGESLAGGYWEKPEESQRTFQARLADTQEGPYLRTGDLGFFLNGQIYIAGRIKDIMIFQGQNFYPQDIEWTVQESHPLLQKGGGAAYSVEVDGREQLVVSQELASVPSDQAELEKIASTIRRAVAAQHGLTMYAVVFLRKGTLPKTSSGKIQHHAAQQDFVNGKQDTVVYTSYTSEVQSEASAPQNEMEAALAEIFEEVLKVSPIGVEDNFFERGGDSLGFIQITELVEERLGIVLPLDRPMEDLSVRTLARTLAANRPTSPTTAGPARPPGRSGQWLRSARQDIIRRLPKALSYELGDRLARWFSKQLPLQRLILGKRLNWLKQVMSEMGLPAPTPNLIVQCVYGNSFFHWRIGILKNPGRSEFARRVRVTGLEHVERAHQAGRGVIVLHSHYGLYRLGAVPIRHLQVDEVGLIGGRTKTISLLSFQLARGKEVLERGGILFIAGDGYHGVKKLNFPFFGRQRPFAKGFAEVALTTGADVIPVVVTLSLNGNVDIVYHPPLVVPEGGHDEQVHSLVEQYVNLLRSNWMENIYNVRWPQMKKYLDLPPVQDAG